MRLLDVADELWKARQMTKQNWENYKRAVRYFGDYLGKDAEIADLAAPIVNGWLMRESDSRSPRYVLMLRRALLVVWNFAGDNEYCKHPKTRLIRRPIVERLSPKAWPIEWIPKLLAACQKLDGRMRYIGVKKAYYADAYFRVAFDLLCRPSDMRALRWMDIDSGGVVRFIQSKTKVLIVCRLGLDTMASLDRIRDDGYNVFPMSKMAHERMIQSVFEAAGIARPHGESLGHVRHTGGSAIAAKHGNDIARKALGHTPGSKIFERHYLDPKNDEPVTVDSWWEMSQ